MRKYIKKPCGYFWRVRKELQAIPHTTTISISFFPPRKKAYAIKLAFADLPYLKIKELS